MSLHSETPECRFYLARKTVFVVGGLTSGDFIIQTFNSIPNPALPLGWGPLGEGGRRKDVFDCVSINDVQNFGQGSEIITLVL